MSLREPLGPATLVKSVMRPFPYTLSPIDTVDAARSMMAEHAIRHLPVKDAGALVGVLSDRDLGDDGEVRLGDLAGGDAYTVDLTERLGPVLREMAARHVDCALVLKGGRLAGILTATDACRLLGEHLALLAGDDDGAA